MLMSEIVAITRTRSKSNHVAIVAQTLPCFLHARARQQLFFLNASFTYPKCCRTVQNISCIEVERSSQLAAYIKSGSYIYCALHHAYTKWGIF